MKKTLLIALLFTTFFSHGQGEANIWYFGEYAGLDFNSGTPVVLTSGQLNTMEGCATISNAAGQLQFYTDGITVYNKNHQVMANGSFLMGNDSSSQSAVIVPLPGSSTIYYLFTVDYEHGPNGFRYSVVDMSLNNNLGAVTDEKNILITTPTLENVGVSNHANGVDFWVVTHGWDSDDFMAYQLTASGLNLTPVISSVGENITGGLGAAIGVLKFSSSGTKAVTSNAELGFLKMFSFNQETGMMYDPITLASNLNYPYGVEFSPDETKVYATYQFSLLQFDLTADDIPNSQITINESPFIYGQIQIGPDKKIYVAKFWSNTLGVIQNPNNLGPLCNYEINGLNLGTRQSLGGLPSFPQTFFYNTNLQITGGCVGTVSSFTYSTPQTVVGVQWDFGDGNVGIGNTTTHTYENSGTYLVTANVTTLAGSISDTKSVTIFAKPQLLNNTLTIVQCDDDLDGYTPFNLSQLIPELVSNPNGLLISFHPTLSQAEQNTGNILNATTYQNQNVNNDSVYARIENSQGCVDYATINLVVSTTSIPSTFQKTITQCDDISSGSTTDGIATFNFSSVTSEIQNLFPPGQVLNTTYYQSLNDALGQINEIDETNYTNTNAPYTQTIYVRVNSEINNACLGIGPHIMLNVVPTPVITPLTYKQCDTDNDQMYAFDTSTVEATLFNGMTEVTVSYMDQNNTVLPSPLPNPFLTASQIITATVELTNTESCSVSTTITFIVNDLPFAFSIPTYLTSICDDELTSNEQDGYALFDTALFEAELLGNQENMLITFFDENGIALPTPLPNPFLSASQNLTVEISNSIDTTCSTIATIPLIVYSLPNINPVGTLVLCSDGISVTKTIDAGLKDIATIADYTYQWFYNGVALPSEINYSLVVSQEGIYKVEVSNAVGCIAERTVSVTSSEKATIELVDITDLTNENTIVVWVTGSGDYIFSLDNSNFQDSNTFNNVQSGSYTLYIKDVNGCGTVKRDINVLSIPNYFTPNGDGYNDYWNIKDYKPQAGEKVLIYIFDRYGKLMIQLDPLDKGWDGTRNGYAVPSTDYWYVVELNGRTIRGHFTLKR